MHLFSFFLKKGQLPKKLPLYTLLYMAIDEFSATALFCYYALMMPSSTKIFFKISTAFSTCSLV